MRPYYVLACDAMPGGLPVEVAGIAVVQLLPDPARTLLARRVPCRSTTEGESLALVAALRHADLRGWTNVLVQTDDKGLVERVERLPARYGPLPDGLCTYERLACAARVLLTRNPSFEIAWVPREQNRTADRACRAARANRPGVVRAPRALAALTGR